MRINPGLRKNYLLPPFSICSIISRSRFFLFFEAPWKSQPLEIEPKRCNGVQKRGCHLFMKKSFFYKKVSSLTTGFDCCRLLAMALPTIDKSTNRQLDTSKIEQIETSSNRQIVTSKYRNASKRYQIVAIKR